jgi:hypothetical protein
MAAMAGVANFGSPVRRVAARQCAAAVLNRGRPDRVEVPARSESPVPEDRTGARASTGGYHSPPVTCRTTPILKRSGRRSDSATRHVNFSPRSAKRVRFQVSRCTAARQAGDVPGAAVAQLPTAAELLDDDAAPGKSALPQTNALSLEVVETVVRVRVGSAQGSPSRPAPEASVTLPVSSPPQRSLDLAGTDRPERPHRRKDSPAKPRKHQGSPSPPEAAASVRVALTRILEDAELPSDAARGIVWPAARVDGPKATEPPPSTVLVDVYEHAAGVPQPAALRQPIQQAAPAAVPEPPRPRAVSPEPEADRQPHPVRDAVSTLPLVSPAAEAPSRAPDAAEPSSSDAVVVIPSETVTATGKRGRNSSEPSSGGRWRVRNASDSSPSRLRAVPQRQTTAATTVEAAPEAADGADFSWLVGSAANVNWAREAALFEDVVDEFADEDEDVYEVEDIIEARLYRVRTLRRSHAWLTALCRDARSTACGGAASRPWTTRGSRRRTSLGAQALSRRSSAATAMLSVAGTADSALSGPPGAPMYRTNREFSLDSHGLFLIHTSLLAATQCDRDRALVRVAQLLVGFAANARRHICR